MSKIFGIGMNKTGTSSLTNAMYILGYPCLHSAKTVKRVAKENRAHGRPVLHGLTEQYAAFCDSPINYMFKELDKTYPGSKFILTVRAQEPWLVSRIAQFGGAPKLHIRKWDDHIQEVFEYFEDRMEDLLVYDLCGGDGWEPLCAFLGVPVPEAAFPWKNKTGGKRRRRISERLRQS